MKGYIFAFSKKGDLGITKNYSGITVIAIAARIYNSLLLNRIWPEIEEIIRKNQNGFRRNQSSTLQILTICWIIKGVRAKNLKATLLFIDFSKAFDSVHRGKMEQILLGNGLSKETVSGIKVLCKNMKAMVRSPDGDIGILQGDILASYLFIICRDYVLRTSIHLIKENSFILKRQEDDISLKPKQIQTIQMI